jgi:hypothetical protein
LFCKIYFYKNSPKLNTIFNEIDSSQENYTFVTNDNDTKLILKQNNKQYIYFDDIFLESEIMNRIYQNAHNKLTELSILFKDLSFMKCSIFDSIEPVLRDEIIFIEKVKYILKNKTNFLFLFKNYSFLYFHIQLLAQDLGYEIIDNEKIFQIKGNKSILTEPLKTPFLKSFKKNLVILKKSKIFKKNPDQIINNLQKKLFSSHYNNKSICDFVMTPSSDYILNILFQIIWKFKAEKTPYNVIVFDPFLSSQLNTNKIHHLNIFEEAYVLSSIIQNSDEGIKLFNEIKNIIIKNNLSILYFGKYFNPLIEKIFFSASVILIMNKIFQNHTPKSIVAANDGTLVGNSTVSISKKWGIQSFSIRTVNIISNSTVYSTFKADKICVYGKQALRTLVKFGYDSKNILLTGNIRYDYIKNSNSDKQRIFLEHSLNLEKNKKLIVIGMGKWYENDEVWMSKFIHFCNIHSFNLIIKVHPNYKNEKKDIHIQKMNFIKKNCPNLKYNIINDMDSSKIIPAADLVITDHTNFGIESALHKKPWITVNFIKESSNFLQKIFDYSGSIFLEDYDDLEKTVLEVLKNKKFTDIFRNKSSKVVEDYNFHNDGNALTRIFDILTS